MKKIIIFLATILFGANLVNVNFFPQKNKLDILFSLDEKFNGKVIKIAKNEFLITNIKSNENFYKKFDDFFVKEVKISPKNNDILIQFITFNKYKTSVSLTPDGYGLRFRIENLEVKKDNYLTLQNPQDSLDYFSYIISVAILIIIAIILWIIRKKIKPLPVKSDIKILFQKPIDAKNRVVLIEFNNRKYLVLVGNSNILLDVFDENMMNIKQDFDNFLNEEINEKLDNLQNYIKNAEKLKELDEKI